MTLRTYRVRVALGDGFCKTVAVTATDEDAAKHSAEYSLRDQGEDPMAVSAEEIGADML